MVTVGELIGGRSEATGILSPTPGIHPFGDAD